MRAIGLAYVEARGLKGGDWRVDFTSPCVLVTGPNGSGKSAIRNALEYLLGRRVEGAASASGGGIIGLVSGDVLTVAAGLRCDDDVVRRLERVRHLARGVFKSSVLTWDGEPCTPEMLASLVAPEVPALLDLSADALRAELARLALVIGPRGGDAQADMPTTAEALSARREALKKRVNAANEALRAAQKSLDASVRNAPDAVVRPEQVEQAKAQAATARAEYAAWSTRLAEVKARLESAARDVDAWERDERRAHDALSRAQGELDRLVSAGLPESVDDVQARILACARDLEGLSSERAFAEDDLMEARAEAQRLRDDVVRLEQRASASSAIKAKLSTPCCPTCGQGIAPDLVAALTETADADRRTWEAAKAVYESAQQREADLVAEVGALGAKLNAPRGEMERLKEMQAQVARAGDLRVQVVSITQALEDVRARRPGSASGIKMEFDAVRAREPAVGDYDAQIAKLSAALAAHQRLLSDQRERDAAEKVAQGAKADLAALAEYEEKLVSTTAEVLCAGARKYLEPMGLDLSINADGIMLRDVSSGATWGGVGLSGAQRAVLEAALAATLGDIVAPAGAIRVAMVEADEMTGATLAATLTAALLDVQYGALDFALVLTCHEPGDVPPDWQRIQLPRRAGDVGAEVLAASESGGPESGDSEADVLTLEPNSEPGDGDADSDIIFDAPAVPADDLTLSLFGAAADDAAPDANEPQDGEIVDADDVAEAIRAAKLSNDALRVLANREGVSMTASALTRLARERLMARTLTVADLRALIADAAARHPKRAYKRKATDGEADVADESEVES